MSLFGDHVPSTKHQSLTCIMMSVLLDNDLYDEWDSVFLLIAFPKSCAAVQAKHGIDTWGLIWRWLKLAVHACVEGVHPPLDLYREDWPEDSMEYMLKSSLFATDCIWQLCGQSLWTWNSLGMILICRTQAQTTRAGSAKRIESTSTSGTSVPLHHGERPKWVA